jgi:hypothetical protein
MISRNSIGRRVKRSKRATYDHASADAKSAPRIKNTQIGRGYSLQLVPRTHKTKLKGLKDCSYPAQPKMSADHTPILKAKVGSFTIFLIFFSKNKEYDRYFLHFPFVSENRDTKTSVEFIFHFSFLSELVKQFLRLILSIRCSAFLV